MDIRCVVYFMLAATAVVRQPRASAYQYEPPNLQYQAYMPPPAPKQTTLQPAQPTSAAPETATPTLAPTEPQPPQTAPPVVSGGYLPPNGFQNYKSLPEPQPSPVAYLPPTPAPTQAASPPEKYEAPTAAKVAAAATLPPAPEVPPLAEATSEKSAPSQQPLGYMGVPESKAAAVPSTLAPAPQPVMEQTSPHAEAEHIATEAPSQPGAPAGPAPAGYGLPSMVNYGSIKKTVNGGDKLNYIVDKAGKLPEGVGYGYGFPPSPRTTTTTAPPPPTTTVPTTTTPKPTTTVAPTSTTSTPEVVTTPPAPPPTPCPSSKQQEASGTTPCPFSGATTPCPNSGTTTAAGGQEPSRTTPCPSSQNGAKYGARQMVIRQPEEQHAGGDKKVLVKDALCQDLFDKCTEWAADGECEANPFWMRPHCQRSCQSCGVTVADIDKPNADGRPTNCKNHHELCQYWKRGGECESNKDYMTIHCPLSCGFC